jgi:hypothetical protein
MQESDVKSSSRKLDETSKLDNASNIQNSINIDRSVAGNISVATSQKSIVSNKWNQSLVSSGKELVDKIKSSNIHNKQLV